MTSTQIGSPVERIDGRAKVTGRAKYAHDLAGPELAHGVVVSSAVARGTLTRLDVEAARRAPGVLQVFTHANAPKTARGNEAYQDDDAPPGSPFRPLQSPDIAFSAQPIALVVAKTLEQARHAATLVTATYDTQPHDTDLGNAERHAFEPEGGNAEPAKSRGDARRRLGEADVAVVATYLSPVEHHNPIEPHASTVLYEQDGTLTIYDKTQGVGNCQHYVCSAFGLDESRVRVKAPFVGGAFGSGLRPQYQLYLAVMAAMALKRSVSVALTRPQMFTFGHRPMTRQTVSLGANRNGELVAMRHAALGETSRFEGYSESVVPYSGKIYRCADVELDYHLARVDLPTPMDMRAPGASLGFFALESAMDELAERLDMDPLALRLANYADREPSSDLPFSSKELRTCYELGAVRFGWARRAPRPRSMREGRELVGWGMATGMWEAYQREASASATLTPDGRLTVRSAITDIGTGTYTFIAQIAADALGVPLEDVTVELADTSLPRAPLQGGSWTASSVGSAVELACDKLRAARDAHGDDWRNAGPLTATATSKPDEKLQEQYARFTHSAVFVEARVDEDLGIVRIPRVVSAVAAGRILNPRTARSQIVGGVVWGIGMALHEESLLDHRFGRFMNHDLAGYHVPVNADVDTIDVLFVEEDDRIVNPIGAKGLGEIGIVGVAAAVANAVYHATGVRVRSLPITLDKVML